MLWVCRKRYDSVHKSAQINVLAQAQDCVKNTHASRTERAFWESWDLHALIAPVYPLCGWIVQPSEAVSKVYTEASVLHSGTWSALCIHKALPPEMALVSLHCFPETIMITGEDTDSWNERCKEIKCSELRAKILRCDVTTDLLGSKAKRIPLVRKKSTEFSYGNSEYMLQK